MNAKILIIISILFIFICTHNHSYAGEIGEVYDPDHAVKIELGLPGIKYKFVVIEYDNPLNAKWGRDISQLIAQEILGTIVGVRGVGVLNLQQPVNKIILTPEKIQKLANQQEADIAIWGEFYEVDENIYLHSHLRIIDKSNSNFGLYYKPEHIYNTLEYVKSDLPTSQINFAPIKISIQTLANLEFLYEQSVMIREQPKSTARIKAKIDMHDTYYILRRKGNWSHIELKKSGVEGWIRHSNLDKGLSGVNAVVTFAKGLLQYDSRNYEAAERSFDTYLRDYSENENSMNLAMANLLLGNAKMELDKTGPSSSISRSYYNALELIPNYASPINHLAIYKLRLWENNNYSPTSSEILELEKQLIKAIKTDNNINSINILQTMYNNPKIREVLKIQEEDIVEQNVLLEEVKASISN